MRPWREPVLVLGGGFGALFLCAILWTCVSYALAQAREIHVARDLAPSTGAWARFGSDAIFYQEEGPADGAPVVLAHGAAIWSEIWRPTMRELSRRGYRAIAIDIPPFGFSNRPPGASYTRAETAARLTGFARAMNLKKPIVVAHSIGAAGVMEAALREPDAFGAVILVCGALDLVEPRAVLPGWAQSLLATPAALDPILSATIANPLFIKPLYASMMANKAAADDEAAAIIARPMGLRRSTHDLGRWAQAVSQGRPEEVSRNRAAYRTLRPPLALIWGQSDSVTPLSQAQDIASLVPARLHVIAAAGHVPQRERPDAFHRAMAQILQNLKEKIP